MILKVNTLCFLSFTVAAVAHKILPFGSQSSGDVLVVCSALWVLHRVNSGERQMLAGIAMEATGSIQVRLVVPYLKGALA